MTSTTPEEIFIQYCDEKFGKAGTPDSTGRTYTQFERFATYWEIFKVAYKLGYENSADLNYTLGSEEGYNIGFDQGYDCAKDNYNLP